jgi:hypothetical protein
MQQATEEVKLIDSKRFARRAALPHLKCTWGREAEKETGQENTMQSLYYPR